VPETPTRLPGPSSAAVSRGAGGAGDVRSATTAEGDGASRDLRLLARGGLLNLAGSVAGAVLGLAVLVVVTRGLGAERAGALFEAVAVFLILSEAATLGADTGLVRDISRRVATGRLTDLPATLRVAIGPVAVVGIVIGGLVALFAPALGHAVIHGREQAAGITDLRLLAPFIPAAAISVVALSGTRGFGRMLPYVAVDRVAVPLTRTVCAGIVVALGMGSTAMALAWAGPLAIELPLSLLALLVLLRRSSDVRSLQTVRPPRLAREFWRFSSARGMAGVLQILVLWLDVLLVGVFLGPRQAGIYAAASRFAMVGMFALQAVQMAIGPQLSGALALRMRARAEGLYQVATGWLMLASFPLYVVVAVFAAVVMRTFGPGFEAGHGALSILALAMLVSVATGNVDVVLLMGGKSWLNLFNTVTAFAINLGLNLVLIPRLGISGAAMAWAATILWQNVAAVVEVRATLGLHPFGRTWFLVSGAALVVYGGIGLLVATLVGESVAGIVVTVAAGSAIYVPVMWAFRRRLELRQLLGGIALGRPRGEGSGAGVRARPGADGSAADPRVISVAKSALRAVGVATSGVRRGPDFLVIGAKRAGTTSLLQYLTAHPGVAPLFPSPMKIKGIRYFDSNYDRGPAWYRSHFPSRSFLRLDAAVLGYRPIVGEATPYYLFHPLAAGRAARDAAEARIVAILRNPVDRAYSHYRERVRNGGETLTFEDAIDAEPARLEGEAERILEDSGYRSYAHEQLSFLSQGLYLEPLRRWTDRWPAGRALILLNEDLDEDSEGTYRRLTDFLGLPPFRLERFERHNHHPGPAMDPSTRSRLLAFFEPHNRALEAFLGVDLSRWSM
jgi:O-antigen/teichoic acid export membrane protein